MINQETIKKPFWSLSGDETLRLLDTEESGLSKDEAKLREEEFGKNSIERKARLTRLKIFFSQFKSPLIFLLLIAGAVTTILESYKDSIFIFFAVLVNVALGYYQENKAEEALAHLKTYVQDRVRVFRDGSEKEINSEELVPGDIIHLSQGSRIPADCRLLFVNDLSIDESVLTGESLPVSKKIDPVADNATVGDRLSAVFKGTLVVEGFGKAVVYATGSETEIGKIAALLAASGSTESTPLKKSISRFSVRMSLFLVVFTIALFFIGISKGISVFEMFLTSVAVIISAVPEGLPIAMTVILAVGVERLAKRKGVVRKLLAAETLGNTSIILTDKTGTLTEAKISFAQLKIFSKNKYLAESGENIIFKFGIMNTDVVIENENEPFKDWRVIGNSLEKALVLAGGEKGVFASQVKKEMRMMNYLPFTSLKKYSASLFEYKSEKLISILGAPDVLLRLSSLPQAEKDKISAEIDAMAESGERVVAVAIKSLGKDSRTILRDKDAINNLDFLGTISFRDPVRKSAKKAIEDIHEAGIRTVIVTGDHRGTAIAVARELGFSIKDENVINGSYVDEMSDDELRSRLPSLKIVSRVSPQGKVRIARMFKESGEVVAMTGDGINDAASLKEADIGVAMGSGTDVAQDVSDLVLLDNNFKTIVFAIEEGRRIIQNIKKVITYLLSDALQEIILISGSLLMGLAIPINALQILWVNFFSDSFPAISIAFEDGEDYLKSEPKSFRSGLLDQQMKFLIFIVGTISSLVILLAYWYLVRSGTPIEIAKTFTFATFGAGTLFVLFSIRSLTKRIFTYNPFSNPYLLGSVLFGFLIMGIGIYVPFFQNVLGTVSLPPVWLLGVLGIGIFNIVLIEIVKWGFRKIV